VRIKGLVALNIMILIFSDVIPTSFIDRLTLQRSLMPLSLWPKIEMAGPFEMLLLIYQTAWCCAIEDLVLC
jgi:hypothetical protein